MPSKKVFRCGVVGYGGAFGMGPRHLNSMIRNPRMEAGAMCDMDPTRRKLAEKDFPGIETYARLGDMLRAGNLDLVTIITPHNTHARLALQCLNAGVNVVCEKPLAITSAEVKEMMRTAKRKRRMLSVFHNRRWDGDFVALRNLIRKEKIIGRLFRIECGMYRWGKQPDWWRSDRRISGGHIYDWGAHFTDWTLELVNEEIDWVSGYGVKSRAWKGYTNEDHSEYTMRFKGGCLATITISQLSMAERLKWRILGERGSIVPADGKYVVRTVIDDRQMTTEVPYEESNWDAYYENVYRHLMGRARLHVTPESAARVIGVLEACTISAARHSTPVKPAFK